MASLTGLIQDFKQIIRKLCVRDLIDLSNLLDPAMFAGDSDLLFNRWQD